MIFEEIKQIKSTRKELKNFAVTMCVALGLLGVLFWWKAKPHYFYFLIFSLAFLLVGSTLPWLLKPIYKIWMALSTVLGWFMTRVILISLFYLVCTPTSLLARLFGKQFLDIKMDGSQNSYWKVRPKKEFEQSDYQKQF